MLLASRPCVPPLPREAWLSSARWNSYKLKYSPVHRTGTASHIGSAMRKATALRLPTRMGPLPASQVASSYRNPANRNKDTAARRRDASFSDCIGANPEGRGRESAPLTAALVTPVHLFVSSPSSSRQATWCLSEVSL